MTLRRRVFKFWVEHGLDSELNEEEKDTVQLDCRRNKEKLEKSKYYRDWLVSAVSHDLGSTKIISELTLDKTPC
jgi:hypothetical protein